MLYLDKHPKEAVIFLLRMIAHHRRRARAAAARSLDVGIGYHEACTKDAQDALAFYQKHWPGDTAAGRVEYSLADRSREHSKRRSVQPPADPEESAKG